MNLSAPRLFLLAMLALALAACGFQPRGQLPVLSTELSPLHVQGLDELSPLYRELSSALRTAGVSLTTNPDQAKSLLRISERVSDKQVLTTNISQQAVEYELVESLRFSLRKVASGQQGEPQQLRVERVLYNPGTTLLAKQHEEDTLRAEMRRELVRLLLDRLAAQG